MNMPSLTGSGRRASDRTPEVLTFETQKVLRWVLTLLLLPLATWAFRTYDASKLDTTRFVADSLRRETDREILNRVDLRTRAMYCGSLPIEKQAGCQ